MSRSAGALARAMTPTGAPPEGLAGAGLDTPAPGELTFPWLRVSGWVIGAATPVEQVELRHRGRPFARLDVERPRPELARAHPGWPWAARSGFAVTLNLLATGGSVDLELRALLASGESRPLATIAGRAGDRPPAPITAVICPRPSRARGEPLPALDQDCPLARGQLRATRGLAGHPGFAVVPEWNPALDGDGFVWLCDGTEALAPNFLSAALDALRCQPDAAFAVAASPEDGTGAATDEADIGADDPLIDVLSGVRLGASLLVRSSAARLVGGLDEHADSAAAAQWDLAIRLVEAGRGWVTIPAALSGAPGLGERTAESELRWLYRKHAALLHPRLGPVLLSRQRSVAARLRSLELARLRLHGELEPRLAARRRERDRLGAKRHAPTVGLHSPRRGTRHDLARFDPVSPVAGGDRGRPVDRHLVERFLTRHAGDVRGAVLVIRSPRFAARGSADWLETLAMVPSSSGATLAVADVDLALAGPDASQDLIVLAHVLDAVTDPARAIAECARVLRPGGVLLASVPSFATPELAGRALSPLGLGEMLAPHFGAVAATGEGNAAVSAALLCGLAAHELAPSLLDRNQGPGFTMAVARAVQGGPSTRAGAVS